MDNVNKIDDICPGTSIKTEDIQIVESKPGDIKKDDQNEEEVKYFECSLCKLNERYEYFGNNPPFFRKYKLLENCYVIEDPFIAPKQGEILIIGTHCIKCSRAVCKDTNCSIYYDGTYCIRCAKAQIKSFPVNVQEKINKIVLT